MDTLFLWKPNSLERAAVSMMKWKTICWLKMFKHWRRWKHGRLNLSDGERFEL